jgi:Tol biopolymer transport system component
MALSSGIRIGPYEILAPIGAGGMGEVYRAKDPRLGREVAIKVLPATFSKDSDRLRRFEQEARAAGVLNHPNITAVHDIGSYDGSPYIVTELLVGETLRARLASGPLPVRKAIDFAVQIARGLAAAHEKGIVHRDLKPENIFVTRDGRVKILDFGLAKLKQPEDAQGKTDLPTEAEGTEPGVVMGTMGYMSPEQVRGRPADPRSDIFAFGAILYEMLSGQRAFRGDTTADTITAILSKDPPDLTQSNREIHSGLERIVRHCLEKNPEERVHSAHDLAFELEALSGISAPAAVVPAAAAPTRLLVPILAGVAFLAAVVAAFSVGRRSVHAAPPSFTKLTFRRGEITAARFAQDGKTVLYAASWEGSPIEIFSAQADKPESRPFGSLNTDVLSMSSVGELAVSLDRHVYAPFVRTGTLAQIGLQSGGAPREILEDVEWADWSPDGKSLAVVREKSLRSRLEYPIGKMLYETAGWISHPRVSPGGDLVAFADHRGRWDDGGTVAVVDRDGKKRTLSTNFSSLQGLAWAPSGKEIWFTASPIANRGLYAVTLSGNQRLVARVTGSLTIQDIARDGRMLITQDSLRNGVLARGPGEDKERELSWLDFSVVWDISQDGKMIAFSESGEGGGPNYSVLVRGTDGSPAIRLGDGTAQGLSPDGKWVAALAPSGSNVQVVLLPTHTGEPRPIPGGGLTPSRVSWFPDGKRILLTASEPGHGSRLFIQDIDGGAPRALSPEGYRSDRRGVSPDGTRAWAFGPDRRAYVYPLAGGEPTPIAGIEPDDTPCEWGADGHSLYVYKRRELPAKVYLLDVATGKKTLWRELAPADAAGVGYLSPPSITPDGRGYVYNYTRVLSELYLVEGVK